MFLRPLKQAAKTLAAHRGYDPVWITAEVGTSSESATSELGKLSEPSRNWRGILLKTVLTADCIALCDALT